MCGSWYLPKFLFNEGSFTEMTMASLMFLAFPCGSLCTMVKQSGLIGYPEVLLCWCMGDGALRCSFTLSPNLLPDSPMYSSGQLICGHLNLYIVPLFCSLWSLSLGAMRSVFTVFVPLNQSCIPFFLQVFESLL